jgi:hypothetical protein
MKSKVYLVVVAGVILFIMCILFGLTSCCANTNNNSDGKSVPVIEGDSYSLADWKFITASGHRYLYGYSRMAHCGISEDPDNDPGCCPKCSKAVKNIINNRNNE